MGYSLARRHPLVCFLLLAYGISWALWTPLMFRAQQDGPFQPSTYLHLFGSLGPACAALVTARLYGGPLGLRTLVQRMLAWRVAPVWHVVAWTGPFALFVIAVLLLRFVSGDTWQPHGFGRSLEYPHLPQSVYWAASLVFYGWGEETGWRGFALPYLQARYSALTSTLLVSVMWACWHVPLFSFAPGLSRMGAGEAAGWYFSILTGAVLLTWLFNSTRGSVFIVAVFHGTMDIVFVSPGPPSLMTVLGASITLCGLAVALLAGPRDLSSSGKVTLSGNSGGASR